MITQASFDGTQIVHKIKFTNQSTLNEILQSIFDDITIYNDRQIRKLITRSPKGFIPIDQIIKLPIFIQFCQKNPHILITPDQITKCVKQNSRKLIAINYQIRRIQPFVDNIKNKKLVPIYIDRLPNKSTDQVCQFFKNIVGVVYQIYHKKVEKWAIIVIDNFEILQALKDQLYFEGNKLSILNPAQTLTSYSDNERLSSDFNIVQLYQNKNMWQFPQQNQQQEHTDHHNRDQPFAAYQYQYLQQNYDMHKKYNLPIHDIKSKRNFREEELNQRARSLQAKRHLKAEVNLILNFDNTPMLELRNDNFMTE